MSIVLNQKFVVILWLVFIYVALVVATARNTMDKVRDVKGNPLKRMFYWVVVSFFFPIPFLAVLVKAAFRACKLMVIQIKSVGVGPPSSLSSLNDSGVCSICGCPLDGGPGSECIAAEHKKYVQALEARKRTTTNLDSNLDTSGRTEDKILNYIVNNPGKDAVEIAEALGMETNIVVRWTGAMIETGLIGTAS